MNENDFAPIATREELDTVLAPYKDKAEKYDALTDALANAKFARLEKQVAALTEQVSSIDGAVSENKLAVEALTERFNIHNRHS